MCTDDKTSSDENTVTPNTPRHVAGPHFSPRQTSPRNTPESPPQFQEFSEISDLESRYRFERILGAGGMGEVVLAMDLRLNRRVAIKRIRHHLEMIPNVVRGFMREAKSIAAMNHPNIVQIYDFGLASDGPFLVMEFVDGKTLQDTCRDSSLDPGAAIDVVCQLCEGLRVVHAAGIVHRDIKPANILLSIDGTPKLTDFGVATTATDNFGITKAGMILGTLDFMPPEQRQDAGLVDARSDLWSLAATLYQMLTGEVPRVIDLDLVPASVRGILARALKSRKDERFQNAAEFQAALTTCQRTLGSSRSVLRSISQNGECPRCRATNDPNRRFCRGCGASLGVVCLACSHQMPVWDSYCPECGGNQPEFIALKLAEFSRQRAQAEMLRQQQRFDECLTIGRALASVKDERIAEHVPWAADFVASTQAELKQTLLEARRSFEAAQRYRAAFDYEAAIQSMRSMSAVMRDRVAPKFLEQLIAEQQESESLISKILSRFKLQDFDGLLEQVSRAIELTGNRADLLQIQSQLQDSEAKQAAQIEETYKQAAILLEGGDARKSLTLIESLPRTLQQKSEDGMHQRLQTIVTAEDNLAQLVNRCNADGVLDQNEVLELFLETERYLQLNPRHEKIQGMRDKLLRRLQKSSLELASASLLRQLPREFFATLPAEKLLQLPVPALSVCPAEILTPMIQQTPLTNNSLGMQFKRIPPGRFLMGESSRSHEVYLTQPFEIGIYAVTQSHFQTVMGVNGAAFSGPANPIENVSWEAAVEFCRRLNLLPAERAAGYTYRLPTEAEWEYACRAGTVTRYSFGDSEAQLHDYAWYDKNSNGMTHPVGEKQPNPWGLYDMYGNVWEWCADWYCEQKKEASTNPSGPASGTMRVNRGGSWYSFSGICRSAGRSKNSVAYRDNGIGFRVVRTHGR